MARKTKHISTDELNQMIRDLKPGEVKQYPDKDLTIAKPAQILPTGNYKKEGKIVPSKDSSYLLADPKYKKIAKVIPYKG